MLVCENAIRALGGIGTNLYQVPGTSEAIMQIYQQRFSNPPAVTDALIISKLADMVIAGAVRELFSGLKYIFLGDFSRLMTRL